MEVKGIGRGGHLHVETLEKGEDRREERRRGERTRGRGEEKR